MVPRSLGDDFRLSDAPDSNSSQISHAQDMETDMAMQLSPIREEYRILTGAAPLQVTVTVNFHDAAVRSTYNRTYSSSQSFTPTGRLCQGLLRRIDHCSQELITRKDSDALNSTQCLRMGPKPLRFELAFKISRMGHSGPWAERVFRSYQKHALSSTSAKELLRSSHSIIGMFLRRHDKGFHWGDEPAHDDVSDKPETFIPSLAGPLNLACIPRSLFIESAQTWEFVPGFSMELTFHSLNPARYQAQVRRTLTINSCQTTPLNLGLGEDLLWQADRSVQDLLDQKKNTFDLEHANCDGFEGVPDCDCQHFDENALDVQLRIVNNLGPVYEHLHRSVQSRLRLFTQPAGQDCDDFIGKISARLHQFRDRTDKKIDRLNDFDFRIAELTGHGWHVKNCARFTIEGNQSHSRRSVEALLDRIRTGVSDVLRGHDVAIRMIAYKRGHLILDKALIARDHQSVPAPSPFRSPECQQRMFIAQLKLRIQKDIDMICKDTCNLEDVTEARTSPHQRPFPQARPVTAPCRPVTPCSSRSQSSQWTRPGSPASFATDPPTPPKIPPRKTSMRFFPLVPTKYNKQKQSVRAATAARDSAVGMEFDGDPRTFDGVHKSKSTNCLKGPPIVNENRREEILQGEISQGLRPAADVYPASKSAEFETDSNSTHSSMPALTESDTPSPEQSMLITPSCVRPSSPTPCSLPFMDGLEAHHLSGSWMMDTSAPSSSTFSDMERFADPKIAEPQPKVLQCGQPMTPERVNADDSAPVDTPKALTLPFGEEKTPLAHRQMQGPTITSAKSRGSHTLAIGVKRSAPHESFSAAGCSDRHNVDLPKANIKSGKKDVGTGVEPSGSLYSGFPSEGLLLRRVQKESLHYKLHEDHEEFEVAMAIAECDSSETLRPSIVVKQRSIDEVIGLHCESSEKPPSETESLDGKIKNGRSETSQLKDETPDELNVAPAQCTPEPEVNEAVAKVQTSVPIHELENALCVSPSTALRAMTVEDELSRSKVDFFEQDEDSAIESDTIHNSPPIGDTTHVEQQAPPLMGMSDGPERPGHVMPLSDSGIEIRPGSNITGTPGAEIDGKRPLSPIDENRVELDVLEPVLQGLECSQIEPDQGAVSGPLGSENDRHGVEITAAATSSTASTAFSAPESLLDELESAKQALAPVPTAAARTLKPPKPRISAPNCSASRSVSNPHPSPAHLGLGKNHLLPPLPILSSFTTNNLAGDARASWSSSSSWEDYISSGRQSSDSVDTIKPSPSASVEDEHDDPTKRLGTPTAGLLGLHESRWAEFGIRGALTGTHAFDRPSTAPTPESPDRTRDEAMTGAEQASADVYLRPASPRKIVHLRHKKSIGSIVFSSKLNRKESRELRKKESKELKKQDKVAKAKGRPADADTTSHTNQHHDDGNSRFPRAMMLVAGLAFASSVVSRHHS